MDSYTILCVYEQMVHQYMSDNNIRDQLVDEPLLITTISNVLADVCKKMDAQKVLLISDKGNMMVVESMSTPVPDEMKAKRFMKTNTRSATKDIMKVLLILLGVQVVGNQCTGREYEILYHFLLWFVFENEEYMSVSSFHDVCMFVKRQFIKGPSFASSEIWKRMKEEQLRRHVADANTKRDVVSSSALVAVNSTCEKIDAELHLVQEAQVGVHKSLEMNSKNTTAAISELQDNFTQMIGLLTKQVEEQKETLLGVQQYVVEQKEALAPLQQQVSEQHYLYDMVQQEMVSQKEKIEKIEQLEQHEVMLHQLMEDKKHYTEVIEKLQENYDNLKHKLQEDYESLQHQLLLACEPIEVTPPVVVIEPIVQNIIPIVNIEPILQVIENQVVEPIAEVINPVIEEVVEEEPVPVEEEHVPVEEEPVPVEEEHVPVEEEPAPVVEVVPEEPVPMIEEPAQIDAPVVTEEPAPIDAPVVTEEKQEESVLVDIVIPIVEEIINPLVKEVIEQMELQTTPPSEIISIHDPDSEEVSIHEADTESEHDPNPSPEHDTENKENIEENKEENKEEIDQTPEAPMIIDPSSSSSSSEEHDTDGDIQIVKQGNYYMIRGTRVVINSSTCTAIGYLDEQYVFHSECTEYVKQICAEYDILFQ